LDFNKAYGTIFPYLKLFNLRTLHEGYLCEEFIGFVGIWEIYQTLLIFWGM